MQEQVKRFLKTDLTEAEFYSLDEENIIAIKNYLLQLKEIDSKFQLAIQKQVQSIKEKCSWVKTVYFDGLINENNFYSITSIHLYSEDSVDLIVQYNETNDKYEEITRDIPKIYFISKKVKEHQLRKNELNLIQQELREIEVIGRNIYKKTLKPISSISKNFNIWYSPRAGLSIYNEFDLIANYSNSDKKQKEKEYFKDADSKEQLLSKIMINPKH